MRDVEIVELKRRRLEAALIIQSLRDFEENLTSATEFRNERKCICYITLLQLLSHVIILQMTENRRVFGTSSTNSTETGYHYEIIMNKIE